MRYFLRLLALAVLCLTACTPSNVQPGQPPQGISPAQFCADAKTFDGIARSLKLSAKGQKDLADAEAVIWPSPSAGCNANPLPDKWDASIAIPMALAAANIILAESEK